MGEYGFYANRVNIVFSTLINRDRHTLEQAAV